MKHIKYYQVKYLCFIISCIKYRTLKLKLDNLLIYDFINNISYPYMVLFETTPIQQIKRPAATSEKVVDILEVQYHFLAGGFRC